MTGPAARPFPELAALVPTGGKTLEISWGPASLDASAVVDASAGGLEGFLKSRAAREFDAVVLNGALDRVARPDETLLALKSVLKHGGLLVVAVTHAPPWDRESLSRVLERAGFADASVSAPPPGSRRCARRLFDRLIAPFVEASARRVLFGPDARGALDELYAAGSTGSAAPPDGLKGLLADPARRAKIRAALERSCLVVTWPLGAAWALAARLKKDSGESLYAAARSGAIP